MQMCDWDIKRVTYRDGRFLRLFLSSQVKPKQREKIVWDIFL